MVNTTAGHRKRNLIFIGAMVVVAIITVAAVYSWYRSSGGGVDVHVSNMTIQLTDSGFLGLGTVNYVASGQVENEGSLPSGQIQLQLTVASEQGTILYTTYFNPTPSTLGGGERGIFTVPFSSDDLGGYKDSIHCMVTVTSQ